MLNQFSRTKLFFGQDKMDKLKTKKVAIFGVGGVGGYVVEALARSGIYNFLLVDSDEVVITNLNRQIITNLSNIGKLKVDVAKERILEINKEANVETKAIFYLPETKDEFDFSSYDYVRDCVDTVTAKLSMFEAAKKHNCKLISALGAGNKLDPLKLEVADLSKTSVDPLARVLRAEAKKRGLKNIKVVYSKEEPKEIVKDDDYYKELEGIHKKNIVASNAFVPSVMGIVIASEVIKDLICEMS